MEEAATSPSRGRRLAVAGAASIAVLLALGSGIFIAARTPAGDSAASADGPATPQHMDASVHDLGVTFTVKTIFPESVTLSAPTLSAGDVEAEGELWPLNGRDHEGEDLDPLALPAGTPVLISGWLLPPCKDSDPEVTISVTVMDSAGEETDRRYSGSNQATLDSAVRQFCERGPTVTGQMNFLRPSGDAIIGINIVNPGPDEITVEVPAYSDEYVTWTALNGTVPAGARARFEIYGSQVGCEPGERASWQEGRLLIDGQPFAVTSDDAWC